MGAEQRRPLRADGVQDQAGVVQVVLEALATRPAVGQAVAQAVQQDQPREGGQLVQEPGHRRLHPLQPQMAGIAMQENQVQVGVAEHLVGEPAAVRAAGEADGRTKRIQAVYGHDSLATTITRRNFGERAAFRSGSAGHGSHPSNHA
jgi:hypothetical protein